MRQMDDCEAGESGCHLVGDEEPVTAISGVGVGAIRARAEHNNRRSLADERFELRESGSLI